MRAEIANPDGALKPGQFVRVILRGAERHERVAVPQVAVLDGPQGKFVYSLGKDKDGKDVATPRPIVVGDWVDASASNQWVDRVRAQAGRQGDHQRHRQGDARRAGQGRHRRTRRLSRRAAGGRRRRIGTLQGDRRGPKAPAAQPEAKAAEPGAPAKATESAPPNKS